ncbi:MAG: histidinol-phosphatase [Caldilineaceae bacterium]|nr:histidinol-phosphatase [Caldilineaceae bacterium]
METTEAILYESHMHTPLCKHAQGEPEAYAAVAAERGLAGIIVTCHNPPVDGWSPGVRMADNQFDSYVQMVERACQAWEGRVDVRLGMECDFVPGMEAGLERQLQRAEFNHILGSVHPQIAQYRERFFTGDTLAFQRTYFEHLAMAAETGLFDTLAHPDLVKNEFPQEWQVERIADTLAESLDRIAAAGTAMELNTSGLQKKLPEMNPGRSILVEMQARGIPVVLGADAHVPARVAADYVPALQLLKELGFTHVNFFLNRQRQEVAIEDALASLQVIGEKA